MADEARHVLVTGATHGIGLEAAVALAARGFRVSIAGRDAARLQAAADEVRTRGGAAEVGVYRADFSDLGSVRAMAAEVRDRGGPLHVLLNNAGTVTGERTLTVDGHETIFAVNHLAPFLLTRLLLDRLRASAPARVVNVSSESHQRGTMDLDDPGYARGGWNTLRAYERSKLANVLFTRALARRLDGSGVTTTVVHPGRIATNIWSHTPWFVRPFLKLWKVAMLTPAQGAEPLVHLAAAPETAALSGVYFDRLTPVDPAPLGRDEALAERLWEASERWVGLDRESA